MGGKFDKALVDEVSKQRGWLSGRSQRKGQWIYKDKLNTEGVLHSWKKNLLQRATDGHVKTRKGEEHFQHNSRRKKKGESEEMKLLGKKPYLASRYKTRGSRNELKKMVSHFLIPLKHVASSKVARINAFINTPSY